MPAADAFRPVSRAERSLPCWYRSSFSVQTANVPLWFEAGALSKGQIYLNEHNIGRYYAATATRKKMGPQKRYYLPEPWLRTDGPNVLTVFDEHGQSPSGSKLVYSNKGAFG